jgi:hypothetical protein
MESRIAAVLGLIPFFTIPKCEKCQRRVYEDLIQVQIGSKDPQLLSPLLMVTAEFVGLSDKAVSIAVQNGAIDLCISGLSVDSSLAVKILLKLFNSGVELCEFISLDVLLKHSWLLVQSKNDDAVIAGLELMKAILDRGGYEGIKKYELVGVFGLKDVSARVKMEMMQVGMSILRVNDAELIEMFGQCGGFNRILECLELASESDLRDAIGLLIPVLHLVLQFVNRDEIVDVMTSLRNDVTGEPAAMIDYVLDHI